MYLNVVLQTHNRVCVRSGPFSHILSQMNVDFCDACGDLCLVHRAHFFRVFGCVSVGFFGEILWCMYSEIIFG